MIPFGRTYKDRATNEHCPCIRTSDERKEHESMTFDFKKEYKEFYVPKTEPEIYRAMSQLTKDKSLWKENLPYVASLLKNHSPKITAKAMWLLGEMGLRYPHEIASYVEEIAGFIKSENDLLRERAANALGRIGRADYELVLPYMDALLSLNRDDKPNVRLSFIWACENIASNTPEVFEKWLPVFEAMLDDENEKVRMEAPEIFRVIGKRKPELVRSNLEKLAYIAEHDLNRVVRIHATGAIKAILGV